MSTTLLNQVRDKYAAVAQSNLSSDHPGAHAVAEAFGYSAAELASIPAEANMGLSCGNPVAYANLREGETVVDLGCGGGLDVLLASPKVGPTGKAIGIDMTPPMIERAKANAQRMNLTNVEFHHATIDQLPLPSESVDCVVSNCVINLTPDKSAVLGEVARVLKPGGRVAISDIALKRDLPPALADSVAAYVGCIAGAITIADYERLLREAGLTHIQVVDTGKDLNAYSKIEGQSGCCSPAMDAPTTSTLSLNITEEEWIASTQACCGVEPDRSTVHGGLAATIAQHDLNEYAASVQIYAVKPSRNS